MRRRFVNPALDASRRFLEAPLDATGARRASSGISRLCPCNLTRVYDVRVVALAARPGVAIVTAVTALIALAASVGVAVWPIFTLATAVLLLVAVLMWLAPAWAFLVVVAIFGTEGWLKGMLVSTGAPFTGREVATGAAILDVALAVSVAGLFIADRGRSLGSLWRRLDWLARLGIALLAAWVVLSLLQVYQDGSLSRGLDGFRLTQAYVVVAVAGALLLYSRLGLPRLVFWLLVGLGGITSYAALRVIVGPTNTERWFALGRSGPTEYGAVFRVVGSFSSAVGLASYAVPTGVFAYGVALFSPRHRVLAACVFVTAVAATVGTYSRAGILGLGFGALVVTAIAFDTEFSAPRRRRIAAIAILGVLVVGASGTVLASRVSPVTESRLTGILNPAGDASMKMRLSTWKQSTAQILHHPLGTGLGTVGRASGIGGGTQVTTDNSFLKIGREQGIEGALLFVGGLATLLLAIARGIRDLRPERRILAASSFGGVTAFLFMCIFGEFVEQPGKVVAWVLLGLAVASVAAPLNEPPTRAQDGPARRVVNDETDTSAAQGRPVRAWLATVPTGLRVLWLCAFLVLVAGSSALTLFRTSEYTASVNAYSGPRLPQLGTRRTVYMRTLLHDPVVGQQAIDGIPYPLEAASVPGRVHLRPISDSVLVSATAPSPVLASELVNGVGVALANAGARRVGVRAAGELADARRKWFSTQSGAARRRLRVKIASLRSVAASPPSDVAIGPRAVPPPPLGVDRWFARLPGALPPRPDLTTTALVGSVIAILFALVTAVIYASSRRVLEDPASMPVTTSQKLSVP